MSQQSYSASFRVDQSPEAVFEAVTNPRGWWSEEIEGASQKVGDEFFYHYRDVHRCTIRVVESIPGQRVVWHVVENAFSFVKDQREWVDTDIIFDIVTQGQTEVRFTHRGLKPQDECYDVCANAWASYLQVSLRNLITKGQGQPNVPGEPEDETSSQGDFTTSFTVDKTPSEVFTAINDVRAWWTGDIEGNAEEVGQEFTYRFQDIHYSRQKVTELVPGKRVVWRVTEANLRFTQRSDEWAGTDILFEIRPAGGRTELRFTHRGLTAEVECYEACSSGWRTFINGSLFHLLSTGTPWERDFAVKALLGQESVTYPA